MITKEQVRAAYQQFFSKTHDGPEAWNRTLEKLSGPFSRDLDEAGQERRNQIVKFLYEVQKEVELEMGDPYRVAVRDAMKEIRRQKVVIWARKEYQEFYKAVVEEVRRAAGFLKAGPKKQDWSPRDVPMQGDTPPKDIEEALERTDPPTLFISFQEDGQLGGTYIDRPDYFQSWGAATASLWISSDLTYDEIEHEVEEALGELEIWDQEQDEA